MECLHWFTPGLFGSIHAAHLLSCLGFFFCLSSVSCAQCCLCLCVVLSWMPLRFSLSVIFLNAPSVFSICYFLESYSWLHFSLLIKLLYITHFCIFTKSVHSWVCCFKVFFQVCKRTRVHQKNITSYNVFVHIRKPSPITHFLMGICQIKTRTNYCFILYMSTITQDP